MDESNYIGAHNSAIKALMQEQAKIDAAWTCVFYLRHMLIKLGVDNRIYGSHINYFIHNMIVKSII